MRRVRYPGLFEGCVYEYENKRLFLEEIVGNRFIFRKVDGRKISRNTLAYEHLESNKLVLLPELMPVYSMEIGKPIDIRLEMIKPFQ